jgi:hypothetical protein
MDTDYFTKAQVKQRGWTEWAIAFFLGEPDRRRNFGRMGRIYLYAKARVLAAEQTPEWMQWHDTVSAKRNRPGEKIDLLAAIFVANRAAKRRRDAAAVYYGRRMFGLASWASREKDRLYGLKDRGIAIAHGQGRLVFCGTHARLGIYRGEGYCFHSTLLPAGVDAPELAGEAALFVEAKPKGRAEPCLRDAEATLAALPEPQGYTRLPAPRIERPEPRIVEHNGSADDLLEDENEDEDEELLNDDIHFWRIWRRDV